MIMTHSSLKLYRNKFSGSIIENRSTYLSDVDQLAAIQLSVLPLQKLLNLNKVVTGIELFNLQQRITQRKCNNPFCTTPSSTSSSLNDVISFDEIYDSYTEFIKNCNMIDKADVKIYLKNQEPSSTVEEDVVLSPASQSPANPHQLQLRRILIGYFQLLVNTRDEIALARIIDTPTRGINHQAFTDIRKFAHSKGMPMHQVVSSFVRQLSLAGKGYAPDEKHILFKHKEGLHEFVDLMDKLQTEIDETDDFRLVIGRLCKILKTSFIRCKEPIFSTSIVTATAQEILSKLENFTNQPQREQVVLTLRDFVDYLSCIYDNGIGIDSSQLCGLLSTPAVNQMARKKIPTLASQFKTPDVTDETPKKCSISKVSCTTPQQISASSLQLSTTPISNKEASPDVSIHLVRCHEVKNDPEVYETFVEEAKENMEKRMKNSAPTASLNSKVAKVQKKSKVSKKLKLLPGQKTLAQFFPTSK